MQTKEKLCLKKLIRKNANKSTGKNTGKRVYESRLRQKYAAMMRRGSLTVEGAYIAGIVTLLIFMVLVFYLFQYSRVWQTLAVCETAATFECSGRKTESAEWEAAKLQQLEQSGPVLRIPEHGQVVRSGKELKISFGGHADSPWLVSGWNYRGEVCAHQHTPVATLRKVRALKNLITADF